MSGQLKSAETSAAALAGFALIAAVAVLAGLYGSIFGPYYSGALAIIMLLCAFRALRIHRAARAHVLLVISAGLIAGISTYIVLGLAG
ncbi:hypothetical protein AUR04nite_23940 [Glutamicibacter uratoxydans]|uniref:Uncharacterized protein n=1 Tax=Glutamicibacter uratoxydans TaxID=43667 RepID=A0A4Y4DNI3_GLUUR|nr:hypothetical protein [Glutamicibacter uratoxydans]GED06862.1 hypothetical protein AUR04nite_23940 [Glutamicibacter uratoxydans]